ncbi:MAG: LPS export ABC transporter periplasmic protein LptC [Desulfobacteraceae bacterium]|nr:MAG: LPS export ABC transporter periplasmic protein LptC [Desulfobacteraceae bacterium]
MADGKRALKWILTTVVLLGLSALLILFLQLRRHQGEALPLPDTAARALMTLAGLRQTATKDGKVQWDLDAESAQLEAESRRMILKAPKVVFHTKDGARVLLTAARGVLDTRTNDMEVSGNVHLRSDRYTLLTESLAYWHERRILQSDVPVHISGSAFDLRSEKMTYNLETNTAQFDGQVEGNLNEDMAL